MKTKRILILEDDLKTLHHLLGELYLWEDELFEKRSGFDLSVMVLSEHTQVEEYANKKDPGYFDAILLDRDCKICGSFHCLDFEKHGTEKIISISTTPRWNKEAVGRGVKKVIYKDHEKIDIFAKRAVREIKKIIQ